MTNKTQLNAEDLAHVKEMIELGYILFEDDHFDIKYYVKYSHRYNSYIASLENAVRDHIMNDVLENISEEGADIVWAAFHEFGPSYSFDLSCSDVDFIAESSRDDFESTATDEEKERYEEINESARDEAMYAFLEILRELI